jgi:hypothetical protein
MEISAAELTADHLGRRIRVDRTDDDQTWLCCVGGVWLASERLWA